MGEPSRAERTANHAPHLRSCFLPAGGQRGAGIVCVAIVPMGKKCTMMLSLMMRLADDGDEFRATRNVLAFVAKARAVIFA